MASGRSSSRGVSSIAGAGSPAAVVVVVSPAAVVVVVPPAAVVVVVPVLVRARRRRSVPPPVLWSWWSPPRSWWSCPRRGGGRRAVALGRGGGVQGLGWQLDEHGSEPQLGRGSDQVEGALLLVDPGQLHDDGVPLAGDLGLGHAEGVDAVANDLDGLVEGLVAGLLGGLQHHRHTALEVESELGDVSVTRHAPRPMAAVRTMKTRGASFLRRMW